MTAIQEGNDEKELYLSIDSSYEEENSYIEQKRVEWREAWYEYLFEFYN